MSFDGITEARVVALLLERPRPYVELVERLKRPTDLPDSEFIEHVLAILASLEMQGQVVSVGTTLEAHPRYMLTPMGRIAAHLASIERAQLRIAGVLTGLHGRGRFA